MKRMYLLLALAILFSMSPGMGTTASPTRAIVIVANGIDYDEGYGRALEAGGTRPFHIASRDFTEFREYMNILLIGGPEAPQTGDIIRAILSQEEIASLRERGEGKLIVKEDVWSDGQTVFVIGGWDRVATSHAAWKNLGRVADSLRESRTVSSGGTILWMKDDLEAGFARAKVEGRLVLVYMWAPWCKWCQKMEAEVFPASCVQEIIGERYVPVRLDYGIPANADFAHSYFLWGTPSFLIFDAEGEKVGALDGYQDFARFCERLRKHGVR